MLLVLHLNWAYFSFFPFPFHISPQVPETVPIYFHHRLNHLKLETICSWPKPMHNFLPTQTNEKGLHRFCALDALLLKIWKAQGRCPNEHAPFYVCQRSVSAFPRLVVRINLPISIFCPFVNCKRFRKIASCFIELITPRMYLPEVTQ